VTVPPVGVVGRDRQRRQRQAEAGRGRQRRQLDVRLTVLGCEGREGGTMLFWAT